MSTVSSESSVLHVVSRVKVCTGRANPVQNKMSDGDRGQRQKTLRYKIRQLLKKELVPDKTPLRLRPGGARSLSVLKYFSSNPGRRIYSARPARWGRADSSRVDFARLGALGLTEKELEIQPYGL